jgi:hypothetical protein
MIFGTVPPNPSWRDYRRMALDDLEKGVAVTPNQPQALLAIAQLNLLPGGDAKRVNSALEEAIRTAGTENEPLIKVKALLLRAGLTEDPQKKLADLDEAVLGVRQSAFGYSGQKCSACSRLIVLDAVADTFLRRLVEATRTLVIGDPREPGTDVGPVIDENAAQKIREYLEVGKSEGRLELACEVPAGLAERVGKPYVGPHIFSGIGPQHRLFHEEVFGPVLAVTRAGSFQEALELANAVDYRLTGGVFSRKPSHLEAARRQFRVGNLYLNRGITGALVGR